MTKANWLILMAILVGGLIPIQSSINAQLGQLAKHPLLATFVNFLGGTIVLAIIIFVIVKPNIPSLSEAKNIPLYLYLGGILGITFVSTIILLTPHIGITNMLTGAIVGQIVISVILDHYGWFNLPVHAISWQRISGIILLLLGTYLTQK